MSYSQALLYLERVHKVKYERFVTLTFLDHLEPQVFQDLWTKSKRVLRSKGLVAFYAVESTEDDRIHVHLLTRNGPLDDELKRAFEKSLPDDVRWQIHGTHDRIRDVIDVAYYITKAKRQGKRNGKIVPDKHSLQRRLLVKHLPFKKVGHVGNFWVESKETIDQKRREQERFISEGRASEGFDERLKTALALADWFGPIDKTWLERTEAFYAGREAAAEPVEMNSEFSHDPAWRAKIAGRVAEAKRLTATPTSAIIRERVSARKEELWPSASTT